MNEDLREVREQGSQKSRRRALQGDRAGNAKILGQMHTCSVQGRAERPVWLQRGGGGQGEGSEDVWVATSSGR